jgi:hypothetical protein
MAMIEYINEDSEVRDVIWETKCTCGARLAVIVIGGSISVNKLYRSVQCAQCGAHHNTD